MRHWTPPAEGALGDLPRVLQPLEPLKNDITILSNLTANWGRPLLVGAGDHGRAAAAYMTGMQVYRTAGADLKLGISADQIAAKANGHLTRFLRLKSVWKKPGRPATATRATRALTRTTCRGKRSRNRCLRSPIRAVCSSGSSAPTWPNLPPLMRSGLAMRRSILDLVSAIRSAWNRTLAPWIGARWMSICPPCARSN